MLLADLPEECLAGRLGEICSKRFKHLPRAYSWIALLTAGSALVDQHTADCRANLFGCLVGGVHTGKTQAIRSALRALGIERPVLLDVYAGSAEAVARECTEREAMGNPRLWYVDELGHLLEKSKVEHASFPYFLNSAWDFQKFRMRMARRETADINCQLSVIGGLVTERFADHFGRSTTAGLYDRILFGLCPEDFIFYYHSFNGLPEAKPAIGDLRIDPLVDEWSENYQRLHPDVHSRVMEICKRAALVCAHFDGLKVLPWKYMTPFASLAEYQTRLREVLKPNPGENFEGQLAHAILQYLARIQRGATRREIFHAIHAYDKGPSIADRALATLVFNRDILVIKIGRKKIYYLAGAETLDDEEDDEQEPSENDQNSYKRHS